MKYAFVTGGAGGIAGAIVEALDKTGEWTVFATYHSKPLTDLQASSTLPASIRWRPSSKATPSGSWNA